MASQKEDELALSQKTLKGHVITELRGSHPAKISIAPEGAEEFGGEVSAESGNEHEQKSKSDYKRLTVDKDSDLVAPLPHDPLPARGRAPVYYEPQGYAEVAAGYSASQRGAMDGYNERFEEALQPQQFATGEQFEKFAQNFKREDGKYVAMTAYGAVPIPDELMKTIPEKFESQPIYHENETFVLKKKHHDRVTEKPFTQHQHHFVEVVKKGVIDKVVPTGEEKVIKIPKYFYKAVIAENIIEVPQGTRYSETPIDVHMRYPPKLVPVKKPVIIERNLECTKPVVQEKIIEVPKVTKKSVPKTITKEIPFIVPKYVEKVVEVPYRPGMVLPPQSGYRDYSAQDAQVPDTVIRPSAGRIPSRQGSPMVPSRQRSPMAPSGSSEISRASPAYVERMSGSSVSSVESRQRTPSGMTLNRSPFAPSRGAPMEKPHVDGDTLIFPQAEGGQAQTIVVPPNIREIKLPFEAKIDVSVVQISEDNKCYGGLTADQVDDIRAEARTQVQAVDQVNEGFGSQQGAMSRPHLQLNQTEIRQPEMREGGPISHSPGGYTSQSPSVSQTRSMQGASAQIVKSPSGRSGYSDGGWGGEDRGSVLGSIQGHERSSGNLLKRCIPESCSPEELSRMAQNVQVPLPPRPKPTDPQARYATNMDPIVTHDIPGMRSVKYKAQSNDPQVLTQTGPRTLSRLNWFSTGDPTNVLRPPLKIEGQPLPMNQATGLANVEELHRIQEEYRARMNPTFAEAIEKQQHHDTTQFHDANS